MAVLGRLADRMLGAVLPKAAAGACACNDSWCTTTGCASYAKRTCRANCDCSKVTCGYCTVGYC